MGKTLRRLLIALVVIVALVALTDRVANAVAERRIATVDADTAADHGAYSDQRPDVTVHGWPFVTQAYAGEFERIDIALSEVGAEGLVFPNLDMVAHDVSADWRELSDGGGEIVAGTVEVTGSLSIESLEALLRERTGFDLSVGDDGSASVTSVIDALGLRIEVVGTGSIRLGPGALGVVPDVVEAVTEGLPPGAQEYVDQAAAQLTTVIDLPELPWGLELTELTIANGAVEVAGSAQDVPLT